MASIASILPAVEAARGDTLEGVIKDFTRRAKAALEAATSTRSVILYKLDLAPASISLECGLWNKMTVRGADGKDTITYHPCLYPIGPVREGCVIGGREARHFLPAGFEQLPGPQVSQGQTYGWGNHAAGRPDSVKELELSADNYAGMLKLVNGLNALVEAARRYDNPAEVAALVNPDRLTMGLLV